MHSRTHSAVGVLIAVVLWSIAAPGCATPAQHGSFVKGQHETLAALAADAASKLTSDYPPSTTWMLGHPSADTFGRGLAAELQAAGFSVVEHSDSDANEEPKRGEHSGTVIRYVVDEVRGTNLLRVVIYVGQRAIARAYRVGDDGARPAGPWSSGGSMEETSGALSVVAQSGDTR